MVSTRSRAQFFGNLTQRKKTAFFHISALLSVWERHRPLSQ